MDRVTIEQAAHPRHRGGVKFELLNRLDEARSIDDEEQRIVDELETASEEEKTALLFKARELQERRKMVVEKVALLIEESDDTHAGSDALDSRVDASWRMCASQPWKRRRSCSRCASSWPHSPSGPSWPHSPSGPSWPYMP